MLCFKAIFAVLGGVYGVQILGLVFDPNPDPTRCLSVTHFLWKTCGVEAEIYSFLLGSIRETSAMYCSMRAALSRCMRSDTWP